MTNVLLGLLMLVQGMPAYGQYAPPKNPTIRIVSEEAKIDITTTKVARLYGTVDGESWGRFKTDMIRTQTVPGDRVILINSNGGDVEAGNKMIDMIKAEQKQGTRVVCYAFRGAHSMAFNFLTNCDVRLMAPGTMSLVHKIRRGLITETATAKNLRQIADDLDKSDEPFRQANAKAMGMSIPEYDKVADEETYFTAETLLKMKYLHGIGTVEK